ncbi:MAG: tetratricopeptide repeat protein, partial [Candidatus Hermodarchaeia archaeon]
MSTPPDAKVLFDTGRKLYAKKEFKEALKTWKEVQKLFQSEGKKRELGIVSTEIGKALLALGQRKEALVNCTQAVRILREIDDPPALRSALLTMGRVLEEQAYLEEANRAYIQALDIPDAKSDREMQIRLLMRVGNSLARVGNYRESAHRFENAMQLSKDVEDSVLRGETLAGYAKILQHLDEHDKAEEILTSLIRFWDMAGKPEHSAYAYLGLASTYLAEGYLDKAFATIQQAQSLFTNSKDQTGLALSEYHQARLILQRGQPEEALAHGEAALKHFEKEKNYLAYAETALVVAQILEQLVQDVRALRLFDKAIEFFVHLKEKARELQTHVLKGKSLLRIGKQKQAEQEFTQAIRYYQEHSRKEQEASVYIQAGEMFFELGKFIEAVEQSKLALNILQHLNEEKLEIRGFRLLLDITKQSQRFDEELPFLQEGLKRSHDQGKSLLASTLTVSLAQLSFDTQSPEQVQVVLEKAIHDEQLPTELRSEAAISLGTVLMKTEHYSEAAQYLSQAIKDFGEEPGFNKNEAYRQLAEAYRQLGKPDLQKQALLGAVASLPPGEDAATEAQLLFDLAPLIETEDTSKALEYYEKAASIFSEDDHPREYFQTLLRLASLKSDFSSVDQTITKALSIGRELDIPLEFKVEDLPLPWENTQNTLIEAIHLGAQKYHQQNDSNIVDRIIDWSSPRKVAQLHPFLTDTLG